MMKSGFWRRASIGALVYALVFVGLVFLQYSSPAGLSWREGIVSLRGGASSPNSTGPSSLELSIGGLRLVADARRPAVWATADGRRLALALRSVEKSDTGVVVGFDQGLTLRVEAGSGQIRISVTTQGDQGGSLRLSSPAAAPGDWSRGDAASLVSLRGDTWRVGLPAATLGGDHVDIPLGSPVLVELLPKPQPGAVALAVKSDVDYRQSILAWLDKAWNGLGSSRFDPAAFKWKSPDGNSAFSEPALAAWLAESLRRGQGEAALAKARQSRDLFSHSLTWLTVPYFGDTLERMADFEAADARAARTFAAQIAAKDPGLLEVEGLVPRLVDRSPKGLAASAMAFLATLDPSTLSLAQNVGLLSAAASAGSLLRGSAEALPNHLAAEDLLLGSLVSAQGAWFLKSDEGGDVDVALSLKAGLALVSLGKAEGKDKLLSAGQALVDGALSLSDEAGFLPATLVVSPGSLGSRTGNLAPEALYAELADNPWYPHEQSFAKDLEPGVWAWTCAPNLTVEAGASRRIFSATYTVGLPYYMTLYGVGGFSNIKLYGIDYSPDAQFESYNVSGYFYRGSTGALYLKMRHKVEVEKIELDY